MVNQYETDGNTNVRIKTLQNVITILFHQHYKDGLFKWVHEDAFTELFLLGQKAWDDDEIKKCRLVQNAQNIDMVDTAIQALVNDKSFTGTCYFLTSHAIKHDHQNKEKGARYIHKTYQSASTTREDKVKTDLELINELQLQDLSGSDDELDISQSSKTALVYKLAQMPPEIWMTLPLEAKEWLLNERKHQHHDDEKLFCILTCNNNLKFTVGYSSVYDYIVVAICCDLESCSELLQYLSVVLDM